MADTCDDHREVCPRCLGHQEIAYREWTDESGREQELRRQCPECDGTGWA